MVKQKGSFCFRVQYSCHWFWPNEKIDSFEDQILNHIRSCRKKSLPKALKPLLTLEGKRMAATLSYQHSLLLSSLFISMAFLLFTVSSRYVSQDSSMPLWRRHYLPASYFVTGLTCDLPKGEQGYSLTFKCWPVSPVCFPDQEGLINSKPPKL